MSTQVLIGLMVSVSLYVAAQFFHVRALVKLNAEQRNQVVTYRAAGSARRTIAIVGLVMLTITIFTIMYAIDIPPPSAATLPAMALAFTPWFWGQVTYMRGLRSLGLPEPYVVAVQRTRLLGVIGVLAFMGALAFA